MEPQVVAVALERARPDAPALRFRPLTLVFAQREAAPSDALACTELRYSSARAVRASFNPPVTVCQRWRPSLSMNVISYVTPVNELCR